MLREFSGQYVQFRPVGEEGVSLEAALEGQESPGGTLTLGSLKDCDRDWHSPWSFGGHEKKRIPKLFTIPNDVPVAWGLLWHRPPIRSVCLTRELKPTPHGSVFGAKLTVH